MTSPEAIIAGTLVGVNLGLWLAIIMVKIFDRNTEW